jgi:hypothetical protein
MFNEKTESKMPFQFSFVYIHQKSLFHYVNGFQPTDTIICFNKSAFFSRMRVSFSYYSHFNHGVLK